MNSKTCSFFSPIVGYLVKHFDQLTLSYSAVIITFCTKVCRKQRVEGAGDQSCRPTSQMFLNFIMFANFVIYRYCVLFNFISSQQRSKTNCYKSVTCMRMTTKMTATTAGPLMSGSAVNNEARQTVTRASLA